MQILRLSSIESSFIIIAADLPSLRPVFESLLGRRNASGGNSYRLDFLVEPTRTRSKAGRQVNLNIDHAAILVCCGRHAMDTFVKIVRWYSDRD